MKKQFALLTIALFCFSSVSFACQCVTILHNFCESSYYMNVFWGTLETSFIAKVVVEEHIGHGVKIRVLDPIYGNETRDTLMVWGDWSGVSCRGSLNYHLDNDTLVVNIVKGHDENSPLENSGDYVTYGCSIYSIPVKNEQVIGWIAQDFVTDTLSYSDFRSTVGDCYTTSIESPALPLENSLFPNPCQAVAFFPFSEEVYVWNQSGACVLSARQTDQIDTASLPAGLYFVEHVKGNQRTINKLLKW